MSSSLNASGLVMGLSGMWPKLWFGVGVLLMGGAAGCFSMLPN